MPTSDHRPSRGLPVVAAFYVVFGFLAGCQGRDTVEPTSRILAVGDLHGDLDAARRALRLAGAIGEGDHWVGGDLVVVQTGDILDRGDEEPEILDLFRRVSEEAQEAGGAVYVLNGNHELMNAYLDYRYVTDDGLLDFSDGVMVDPTDSLLASLDPEFRNRAAAFRPGGPVARVLAERTLTKIIGTTLFTHGGILPEHVDMGLDRMEWEVHAWLLGEAPQPEWIRGDRSPVWTRLYSDDPTRAACDTLSLVLDRLGLERMVVGHTVQPTGITAFCGGRVWCIDVGMSEYYGSNLEVLEIRGESVRSIRSF